MELEFASRQASGTGQSHRLSRLGLLQEPMGYVDGANVYEFVTDDPADLVDPLGQAAQAATTQPTTAPTLAWGDFQGTSPDNPDEDAYISIELATDYGIPQIKAAKDPCNGWNATATYPNVTITATFDKKASWVVKGQTTDSLLQHEVFHLIIAQIGAGRATQKFRTLIGKGNGDTQAAAENAAIDDLQQQIKAAFTTAQKETQDQEQAYDDATDHGRNNDQQSQWQKKIQQWQAAGTWN